MVGRQFDDRPKRKTAHNPVILFGVGSLAEYHTRFADFHPDITERKAKTADLTGEIADCFLPISPQSAIGKNGKPFLSLPVLVIILRLFVILILGGILYHIVGRL